MAQGMFGNNTETVIRQCLLFLQYILYIFVTPFPALPSHSLTLSLSLSHCLSHRVPNEWFPPSHDQYMRSTTAAHDDFRAISFDVTKLQSISSLSHSPIVHTYVTALYLPSGPFDVLFTFLSLFPSLFFSFHFISSHTHPHTRTHAH